MLAGSSTPRTTVTAEPSLRTAAPDDASLIAALAIQVFLDTYASDGIRPDLAREALRDYGVEAFLPRLREPQRRFLLAERAGALLGFAELSLSDEATPAGDARGAELVRLYVQPAAQGGGLGRQLIRAAEALAAQAGLAALWLTAWDGNHRALAFYTHEGYADIGATTYRVEHMDYVNRVLLRPLADAAADTQAEADGPLSSTVLPSGSAM
jgi:GNAT superfamily N-acetyltransferase